MESYQLVKNVLKWATWDHGPAGGESPGCDKGIEDEEGEFEDEDEQCCCGSMDSFMSIIARVLV